MKIKFLLIACTVFGLAITPLFINKSNNTVQSPKTVVDVDISSDASSPSTNCTWVQTQGYEWIEINYINNSNYTAVITLDGDIIKEVASNTSDGYIANPIKEGNHKISISARDGGNIEGNLNVVEK